MVIGVPPLAVPTFGEIVVTAGVGTDREVVAGDGADGPSRPFPVQFAAANASGSRAMPVSVRRYMVLLCGKHRIGINAMPRNR
jgi:hypothetical protein